jgi:hypothetical protein
MSARAVRRLRSGPGAAGGARARRRSGLILAVVLVVISLLALTLAGFIFFVQAERAGMSAYGLDQQARLTAESGLEELVAILRLNKHNAKAWYDDATRFRHALVWGETYDRQGDPVRDMGSRKQLIEPADIPETAPR